MIQYRSGCRVQDNSIFLEAHMRLVRIVTNTLLLVVLYAAAANAAPVSFTLNRTTDLFVSNPSGTPLGRTGYDGGELLFNGTKIGEYMRVFDVHAAGLNTASLTLTLFIPNPAGGPPTPITLQGAHDYGSGGEVGSISASGFPGLVGVRFTAGLVGGFYTLTLLFP
jgi:hypothetical protein